MARWEPNARERLEEAAMELFQERGYVETTVGDIAARAGLTERTFFRYFTDKREVLFSGSEALHDALVAHVANAPPEESALDIVASGFEAAATRLESLRDMAHVRARWALLSKHTELQERELIKLASLTTAMKRALEARGISETTASLAAEVGMTAFKVGFQRWVTSSGSRKFATHVRAALSALRDLTSSRR